MEEQQNSDHAEAFHAPRDVVRTREGNEALPHAVEGTVETPTKPQVSGPPSDHQPEGQQSAWTPNPNQRKPFEPGHTLSLIHGANSDRTIAARAELVRPRLYDVCPWLHDTMDIVAVDRFLRAESRALILHEYIIEVVDEKGAGKVPSRLWEQATAADNLAAKLGHTLGLDPTGRAKLQQTVASTESTLVDLAAQGASIRAARTDLGTSDADA